MDHHRLDWKHGTLWYNGRADLNVSGECDAARKMVELGLAQYGDRFTTYRGDMPCLTMKVKWAAEHEVGSSNEGTPILRKLRLSRGSRAGKREEA